MTGLSEHLFTDLVFYCEQPFFKRGGYDGALQSCPANLSEEVADLYEKMVRGKEGEFMIDWEGLRFRVASLVDTESQKHYFLRRIPTQVPTLDGYNELFVAKLMQNPRQQGLLLAIGPQGSGKTTFASAVCIARLNGHGGHAVCIEDPPEYLLQGQHGSGLCFQRHCPRSGFAEALVEAYRYSAPDVLFLGEIRDEQVALEVLKAASNGQFVISTIHGCDVPSGLQRLEALASGAASSETVRELMAHGLFAAVSQTLSFKNGKGRVLNLNFLFSDVKNYGVRKIIASGEFSKLESAMQAQKNELLNVL